MTSANVLIRGKRHALSRILLLCASAVLATPAFATDQRAQGQAMVAPADEAVAAEGGMGEIVVTGEKRDAKCQHTPIAISAYSWHAPNDRGVIDLNTMQQHVPDLYFTASTNFSSGVVVTLRGVGADSMVSGSDQGVAVHLEGVYVGEGSAALLRFRRR